MEFLYDVFEASRYVLVNYGEPTEFMVSLSNRRRSFTYTFDVKGVISFYVLMDDLNHSDHAKMTLTALKPTGYMIVSDTKGTIEI